MQRGDKKTVFSTKIKRFAKIKKILWKFGFTSFPELPMADVGRTHTL